MQDAGAAGGWSVTGWAVGSGSRIARSAALAMSMATHGHMVVRATAAISDARGAGGAPNTETAAVPCDAATRRRRHAHAHAREPCEPGDRSRAAAHAAQVLCRLTCWLARRRRAEATPPGQSPILARWFLDLPSYSVDQRSCGMQVPRPLAAHVLTLLLLGGASSNRWKY